jgi:methionyl-tRNA formyltransferase
MQIIDQLTAGTAQGTKQDKSQVTKAPKLKKEDGLIDWSRSPKQICNQIRAMQPWPTAYTFFYRGGKSAVRVIVTKVKSLAGTLYCDFDGWSYKPGQACLAPGPTRLWVATGEEFDLLEILEVQPAGKKRMSAAEFLRGHPIKEGDHFGPENE